MNTESAQKKDEELTNGQPPAPDATQAKNEPPSAPPAPAADAPAPAKPASPADPAPTLEAVITEKMAVAFTEMQNKMADAFAALDKTLAALKPPPAPAPASPADPNYKRTHEDGTEPPPAPGYMADAGVKDAQRTKLVAEYQAANDVDFDAAWNAIRASHPDLFT